MAINAQEVRRRNGPKKAGITANSFLDGRFRDDK